MCTQEYCHCALHILDMNILELTVFLWFVFNCRGHKTIRLPVLT